MKVLWFTNTACSATEIVNPGNHRGGWLSSLELHLAVNPDVDLNICFYTGKKLAPFRHNHTSFHPVYRKNSRSKISKYIQRFKNITQNDQNELQELIKVVNAVKPDLIHIHGTEDNFGLIQRHISIPVVISIQGILTPYCDKYYSGIPALYSYIYEGLKPKLLMTSASASYKRMRAKAIREREILMLAKHLIGRTSWDQRVAKVLSPSGKYYFNNELMREAFYTQEWEGRNVNKKEIKIVTITSENWYKGYETIEKTMTLLREDANYSYKWTVIGLNQKNNLVKVARKWLKENKSNQHISLVGSANESQIIEHLKGSDIYCQVSHIENSPNSLCEAMTIGMPVIATYAGGTSSLLKNEESGLLIQAGDAYALAGAIMELSSDPESARKMGQEARKEALQRHNPTTISNDLINIYKAVSKEIK